MEEFINAIDELNAIHLVEYDGSWEGFHRGDPGVLAEEVAEKLVTARAIESILGIEAESVESIYEFKEGEIGERLEDLREKVNGLEDRRGEIVERVTDMPLRNYLTEAIFTPTGMTSTNLGWREDFESVSVTANVGNGVFEGGDDTTSHWNHNSRLFLFRKSKISGCR